MTNVIQTPLQTVKVVVTEVDKSKVKKESSYPKKEVVREMKILTE